VSATPPGRRREGDERRGSDGLWAGPHRRVSDETWGARRRPPLRPSPPEKTREGGEERPPEKGRSWSLRSALAGAALVALGIALAALLGVGGNDSLDGPPVEVAAGGRAPATSAGRVYAAVERSVVSVQAGSASGTGFVVSRNGTIVTNSHVVSSESKATIRFGDRGRKVDARVLGTDPSSDLAALRVDPNEAGDLRPLALADSNDVRVGDSVIAVGSPFGLDRTATAGIVSGIGREIQAPNGFQIDKVIQTDAPINPGNSGGPLVDARGRVIGVNSQIATAGAQGNVGIGFAVPSNTVREVIPRLARGLSIKRAFLGVTTAPAADGAGVIDLVSGGPAGRAGIKQGDVIVGISGNEIRSPEDVAHAIERRTPGDTVQVEVRREGRSRTFEVELATRPKRTP
jgi:S1-C subfamily serine protease